MQSVGAANQGAQAIVRPMPQIPDDLRQDAFNAVAVVADGRVLGVVAKQHLAGDGIHYEPRWFKPWREGALATTAIGGREVPFGDLLFEVGGASATQEARALDRHWRNARTVASHNPAIARERLLGDHFLNGVNPREEWAARWKDAETKGEAAPQQSEISQ